MALALFLRSKNGVILRSSPVGFRAAPHLVMGKENFANIILGSMTTVRTAAVRAAVVTFVVLMMTANIVGVINEIVSEQSFDRFVGVAGGSAVELYAGLRESVSRAAADASADENVSVQIAEYACERAVTAAHSIYDFSGEYFAVLNFVDLKLSGVAEMLKNVSVFICYCYTHL